MRRRRVKAWGAVAAFIAAPLLFLAALAIESPWVFLAAGLGIWALAIVGVLLTWSVLRPEPAPRPALDPAAWDAAWADALGVVQMQPPPCSDLACPLCRSSRPDADRDVAS